MKALATALLTTAVLAVLGTFPSGSASAGSMSFKRVQNLIKGKIVIPPEWDGIWLSQDSTYACTGAPMDTSSSLDTLCAGSAVYSDTAGTGVNIDCTGFANATTVDVTCTGSNEIIQDCTFTFTVELDATRTGESYRSELVVTSTYSGSAPGCDLIPDDCQRIVTYGARQGPAPAEFCSTPVAKSSWGSLKTRYR
jgi:hypothetical protein